LAAETGFKLDQISTSRLKPVVRLNEGDRVEYNGWLGSIRELEEDRIIIETEDGVVDFIPEEDEKIDSEYRFLSIRGIYEGAAFFSSNFTYFNYYNVNPA